MSYQPRIEEVSDSDPEEMDIEDIDPSPSRANNSLMTPSAIPFQAAPPRDGPPSASLSEAQNKERTKHWQCLYPVYFDANRTRVEGRRVGKALAVANPLAQEIVNAVQQLGLTVLFEPGKTHPKDWANPGRARVLVKKEGKSVNKGIENKHHLYTIVAKHLQANPTTEAAPLRLRIPGMSPVKEPLPPPAAPRGWKMGTILPLHSAAVTGGGVSENLFKDMMAEMQGQAGVGADTGPPSIKPKKEKKKIKP